MLCIGHRGAKGHVLENTLASIQKGIDLGAQWIEIDIHNIENELIVFHDFTLDRLTPHTGLLQQKTLQELRQIDLGDNQRIPLLQEVIDLLPQHIGLNIEIKGANCAKVLIDQMHLAIKNKKRTYDNLLISSFDHAQLIEINKMDPHFLIGVLIQHKISLESILHDIKPFSIHQSLEKIDDELIQECHAKNIKVFVYTVNELSDIQKMHNMGVDGVFSDFPDRVV